MIGLLTQNFSLYHDLVDLLRKRNLSFISLTFSEKISSNVDVIITSYSEKNNIKFGKVIACDVTENLDEVIDKAILLSYGNEAKIVFGIDPGKSIGIAIFSNDKLIRSFIVKSPEEAANFIKYFIKDVNAGSSIVRIGNGARIIRNRIINLLQQSDIRIEMVDENSVAGMVNDTKAAESIAMVEGKEIKGFLSIEPKEGEIREMQRISRIKSKNITISKELAKKVLTGEIELDEAIEMQKGG